MLFKKDSKIVFIGDSVTNYGRAFPVGDGKDMLGNGFVNLIDMFLAVEYPELNLRCVNMGIDGDTSLKLLNRWETDVNALDPDYVVVEIGINDVWRQFDSPQIPELSVLPQEYENNLRSIIKRTKAKMIFMTPYYLETNREDKMRHRTEEYAAICKRVADEHGFPVVDLQAAFDRLLKFYYPAYITWDRVHPGKIGAMVIARAFLNLVENNE